MKKIDFTKLNVETQIDFFEEMNIAKELGNVLHANTSDLGMDELARAIYRSDTEVEMDDALYSEMMDILKSVGLSIAYLTAIKNAVSDKIKDEK